jgi:hypothetical protein
VARWNGMNFAAVLAVLSTLFLNVRSKCLRTMTFIYKQGASPCDNNNVFIILKWQLNGDVLVRTEGFVLSFFVRLSVRLVVPLCVCWARDIAERWTWHNAMRQVPVCSCTGTAVRLPVIIQLAFQMTEVMLFVTNNLSLLVSNACAKVLMTRVHPFSVSFQIFAF